MVLLNVQAWLPLSTLESHFLKKLKLAFVCDKDANLTMMVTKDDDVFSCGPNKHGLLGIGRTCEAKHWIGVPEKIDGLCQKKIKDFAYGVTHMMALTEDGKIYTWGTNTSGQLGNDCTNNSGDPVLVNVANKTIVQITCSENRSMALTKEGEVYAWGKLNGSSSQMINLPKYMNLPERIVQIACTNSQNFILTAFGRVYSWTYSSPYNKFQLIKVEDNNAVVKIACGYSHMLIITSTGDLYAWGSNDNGQLGFSDKLVPNANEPIKVNEKRMGAISDIGTFNISNTSAALTQDGRLYMWGALRNLTYCTPTIVPFNNMHEGFGFYGSPGSMPSPLNVQNEKEEKTMMDYLKEAFDDPTSSDLVIQVQDNPIHVHKAVLKIRSQYFNAMFQKGWKENKQAIIVNDDFSYEAYKCFLKFLYTDQLELPPDDTCEELLNLSNTYLEPALKNKYSKLIKSRMTVRNVLSLYKASIDFDAPELKASCFNFAVKNMAATIEAICSSEVDESTMKTFLTEAVKSSQVFMT